ncbi:DUF4178 domain-containing protein [Sphingosinicella sp. BN140058]|uniref:DUF4178 domain-containing protein n=1 Tax=Sphingosinicella sp. BN140058 TaxID=1892855 RepID=UPI001012E6C5|nr:DUF4178 domain-containing protein [Sphingosinicella sp. BN140058]QAY77433.1 DUF4178 domain-containing protein [Sphingosinicella sp. BN140058]
MQTFACPNCGADVTFRSPALPARICDYCRTMIVRSGDALTMAGKAAVLPFDVSPIMIGTRGRFEGAAFDVIGRVRWGWTDGSWNEWLLLFGDGTHAWLGEAMGHYMLLREWPLAKVESQLIRRLAAGDRIAVGTSADVEGRQLTIVDARNATCIAAEGELPFTAPKDWTIYSVDLRGADGSAASLQRDGQEANLYVGRYVTLAELAPVGLRRIEGWQVPAYGA